MNGFKQTMVRRLFPQRQAPVTFLLGAQLIFALLIVYLFGFHLTPSMAAGTSPILIIVDDNGANVFGRYLGEIMRAEGINTYNIADISTMNSTLLTGYELVVLAEVALSPAQATDITNYVNNGGRIIAMRPDSDIYSLFGINSAAVPTTNNGYIKIGDTVTLTVGSIPPGTGLITETLQLHTPATRYNNLAANTIELADLYNSSGNDTGYPAVVAGSGGRAVAFAYDLPTSIAYTRQGNPANVNVDTDGDGVFRTVDLFQANGGGNPWVNRTKIPIPQADEQQRFFARLVRHLVGFNIPLPQLWYFPERAKSMLILTGDSHGQSTSHYDEIINSVESYGGTFSFYISQTEIPGAPNQDAYLAALRAAGHDMGFHPGGVGWCSPPTLIGNYDCNDTWWNIQFTLERSRTVRNHRVEWFGWADIAEYASTYYDVGMSTDFYHYGTWIQNPSDNSWPMGYITGSGQPMKFVKEDGTILDIYQHLTHLVDEHLLSDINPNLAGLSPTAALTVTKALIDQSLTRDYAALMAQFHVDYFDFGGVKPWAEGTMAYAQANEVPIWSADNWLTFTETRHDSNFNNISWSSGTGTLNFDLDVEATPGMTLTLMVPTTFKTRTLLSVEIDSMTVPFTIETIKGVPMAFVEVPDGTPLVTYDVVAHYSSPTAITLRSYASQVGDALHTDAAAILFVLLGSATLVFMLERRRATA